MSTDARSVEAILGKTPDHKMAPLPGPEPLSSVCIGVYLWLSCIVPADFSRREIFAAPKEARAGMAGFQKPAPGNKISCL
jgi:hypothetical protein